MDLKQLEYFVRVAELGSFTRAAHALQIAQPALSRQIRLLEVELRQNLLVRNGRGALPTEAGQILLEHGRGILHQVARAKETLARTRGGLAGRVAIGLPPSVARVLTVPLTRAFRAELPDAQLSISEGLSAVLREGVLSGYLDIAVLYNTPSASGVDLQFLTQEDLLLVQARAPGLDPKTQSATIALKDVAALPLLIPSRPNAIRMHIESEMAQLGCKPTIAFEMDGVPAILDLVADGAGYALLSAHAVARSTRPSAFTTRTVTCANGPLRIALYLATSANRPSTLTQQATVDLLKSSALALLTSG